MLPTGVARATGRIGRGGCDLLSGWITMRSHPSGPIGVPVATVRPGRALVAPSALYRASFTSLNRFVLRPDRRARASAARSGNSRADGGDMAYALAARGGMRARRCRGATTRSEDRSQHRRARDFRRTVLRQGGARRGVEPALQL